MFHFIRPEIISYYFIKAYVDVSGMEKIGLGLPVITMHGGREVYIDNFKAIIDFNGNMARIATKCGTVLLMGEELQILYFTLDEIAIKGRITMVEFKEA